MSLQEQLARELRRLGVPGNETVIATRLIELGWTLEGTPSAAPSNVVFEPGAIVINGVDSDPRNVATAVLNQIDGMLARPIRPAHVMLQRGES